MNWSDVYMQMYFFSQPSSFHCSWRVLSGFCNFLSRNPENWIKEKRGREGYTVRSQTGSSRFLFFGEGGVFNTLPFLQPSPPVRVFFCFCLDRGELFVLLLLLCVCASVHVKGTGSILTIHFTCPATCYYYVHLGFVLNSIKQF